MRRAQLRDSARNGRFFFRKSIYPAGETRSGTPEDGEFLPTPPAESNEDAELDTLPKHKGDCGACFTHPGFLHDTQRQLPIDEEYEEMSINEIINGNVSGPVGKTSKLV